MKMMNKMGKRLCALVLAFLLVAAPMVGLPFEAVFAEGIPEVTSVSEESGVTGDCTWTLRGSVLTISGNGAMADYASWSISAPWRAKPDTLIIEEGVTYIGAWAFFDCINIKSVSFPDSLQTVGQGAFCRARGLESISFGNGVTTVKDSAFTYCSALTEISLPDNVTTLESSAFFGCTSLSKISIGKGLRTFGNQAFDYCSPDQIEISDENASFMMKDGCMIEKRSKTLVQGTNASVIPSDGSVTAIRRDAFHRLTKLRSITIPAEVTFVDGSTFAGCTALEEILVERGHPTYHAEGNCLIETNTCILVRGCKTSVIPTDESVNTIGENAFYEIGEVDTFVIPDNIRAIRSYAFMRCDFKNVVMPTSMEELDSGAFYECAKLQEIVIPQNLQRIGNYAFYGCKMLKSVVLGNVLQTIGREAFESCPSLTDVWFCGGEMEFSRIAVESGNSYFTQATVHYNYCGSDYHTYENVCSELCSVCEYPRTAPHGFDGPCDDNCNLCGLTREAHVYDNACDTDCNLCGARRQTLHRYETADNAVCLSCGYTRTLPDYDHCGKTGDVFWYLKGTELVIEGYGYMDDYAYEDGAYTYWGDRPWDLGEWIWEAPSLTKVTIGEGVFNVGTGAFNEYALLTEVNLPDTMEKIGYYSFAGCRALTSIEIPDAVTSIAKWAFDGCSSLQNIDVDGVEALCQIGQDAFEGTAWYDQQPEGAVYFADVLYTYKGEATELVLREGTLGIADNALWRQENLVSVVVPEGVTYVGKSAFYDCPALTSVSFPASVTFIGEGLFGNCPQLVNIDVNGNTRYLMKDGCLVDYRAQIILYGGKDAVIPADGSIVRIGNSAFEGNSCMTEIVFPAAIQNVGARAFALCENLKSISFEAGELEYLGESAFQYCTALEAGNLPDRVWSMGDGVFYGCSSMTSVKIPKNLFTLPAYTVDECVSLKSVTIPAGVAYIDGNFRGCTGLESLEAEPGGRFVSAGNCIIEPYEKRVVLLCKNSVIPADGSVTCISESATSPCEDMTSISIPKAIQTIEWGAGWHLGELTDVWYEGTEADRALMNIEEDNEVFLEATWHYECCAEDQHSYDNACDGTCNACEYQRVSAEHVYDNREDPDCNVCGTVRPMNVPGDLDGDGIVTLDDAIYLLFHTNFPTEYPVSKNVDYDADGSVTMEDAVYLLHSAFFPEYYPLAN